MKGIVYFIHCQGDPSTVKIGYTGSSVDARCRALQTGCPFPLDIFARVSADFELEALLHRTFEPLRLRGEWFVFDHKLRDFIWYIMPDKPALQYVDRDTFYNGIHDVVLSTIPPHPNIDAELWNDSADMSCWEGCFA